MTTLIVGLICTMLGFALGFLCCAVMTAGSIADIG